MVDLERAADTLRDLARPQHEMLDEELTAAFEQIRGRHFPFRSVEDVLLLDPDPRQGTALPVPRPAGGSGPSRARAASGARRATRRATRRDAAAWSVSLLGARPRRPLPEKRPREPCDKTSGRGRAHDGERHGGDACGAHGVFSLHELVERPRPRSTSALWALAPLAIRRRQRDRPVDQHTGPGPEGLLVDVERRTVVHAARSVQGRYDSTAQRRAHTEEPWTRTWRSM